MIYLDSCPHVLWARPEMQYCAPHFTTYQWYANEYLHP